MKISVTNFEVLDRRDFVGHRSGKRSIEIKGKWVLSYYSQASDSTQNSEENGSVANLI